MSATETETPETTETPEELSDEEQLLEQIVDRARAIETHYVALGRDLYLCNKHKVYQRHGHATFKDFLTKEVQIAYRRGQRLRQIWKTFVVSLDVSEETLSGCRYSHLLQIMSLYKPKIMTRENVNEWIGRAQLLTYHELEAEVNTAKEIKRQADEEGEEIEPGSITPEEVGAAPVTSPLKRKSFNVSEEEADVIEEAINRAERVNAGGSSRPGHLLANVCTEFLSRRLASDDTAMLPFILNKLEAVYGGKMVWLQDAEMIEAFEEAMAEIEVEEDE